MLYSISASNWRIIMKMVDLPSLKCEGNYPSEISIAVSQFVWLLLCIIKIGLRLIGFHVLVLMTFKWCYDVRMMLCALLWLCVSVLRLIADYYCGFLVILASYLLIRRRSVHKVHCFQLWKICTWRFFSLSLSRSPSFTRWTFFQLISPKLGLRLFLVTLTKTSNSMSRKRCNKLFGVFLHSINRERDDLRKKRDTCK